jgi:hypothetical protein
VIHREHANTGTAERANRREPVDPADVDDRGRNTVLSRTAFHGLDSAERPEAADIWHTFGTASSVAS